MGFAASGRFLDSGWGAPDGQGTEPIVRCDLGPPERRSYDDLKARDHRSLLAKVGTSTAECKGPGGIEIHLRRVLLRLHQSASHPGRAKPDSASALPR